MDWCMSCPIQTGPYSETLEWEFGYYHFRRYGFRFRVPRKPSVAAEGIECELGLIFVSVCLLELRK